MKTLSSKILKTLAICFIFIVVGASSAATSAAPSSFDGPAELPRVRVKSALADTPAPGKVKKVKAADDLQRALNDVACGETLQLEAGTVFAGHFTLPEKHCDDAHWIIVRTSAPDSALPPEGTRLTPCYAGVASLPGRPAFSCAAAKNVLARIEFRSRGRGPLEFAPGANHYRFVGLEITRAATDDPISNLVTIEGKASADHIVFDRSWVHGTAQSETTRGLALGGSTELAIVDSYFTDFHCIARTGTCTDAQAVGGGLSTNPSGPYKIENNFLEASGEVILFGGGPATMVPHDVEIRRNHLFRPLTWMKENPNYVGGTDGSPFIVKNIFELKNGERVLFENNVLENCWGGFSQEGYAILLTPKNQGNNGCPDCRVVDVTIRNSRIKNVAAGFQLANVKSDIGLYAKEGGRYSIHDVLVENLDGEKMHGHGVLFEIASVHIAIHDLFIDHITGQASRVLFLLGGRVDEPKMPNFTLTNNLLGVGKQQILLTGGGAQNCAFRPEVQGPVGVFASCFTNAKVSGNVILGGSNKWPAKNSLVKKIEDLGLKPADPERGIEYRFQANSPYRRSGSDQKDVGADLDAIEAATKDVL